MFTVTFLNVTIAVKIQRLKIFVRPVAIGKKLEKAVCNFLLNVKNAPLHNYFTSIPRDIRQLPAPSSYFTFKWPYDISRNPATVEISCLWRN